MIKGSHASQYCCEDVSNIENYEAAVNDKVNVWECHHKLELKATGAIVNSTAQDLKDWGLYYNRPADELMFILCTEHHRLHMLEGDKYDHSVPFEHNYFHTHKFCGKENGFYGKKHTPEALAKMSRLGSHHSDNTKDRISKTTKDRMAKVRQSYKEYKLSGGSLKWNDFQKQYRGE